MSITKYRCSRHKQPCITRERGNQLFSIVIVVNKYLSVGHSERNFWKFALIVFIQFVHGGLFLEKKIVDFLARIFDGYMQLADPKKSGVFWTDTSLPKKY